MPPERPIHYPLIIGGRANSLKGGISNQYSPRIRGLGQTALSLGRFLFLFFLVSLDSLAAHCPNREWGSWGKPLSLSLRVSPSLFLLHTLHTQDTLPVLTLSHPSPIDFVCTSSCTCKAQIFFYFFFSF